MAAWRHWRRFLELGFCAGVGFWAVTDRYTDLVPHGDALAAVLLQCSIAVMLLCAAILIGLWTFQYFRTRAIPLGVIVLAGSLIASELFWRFMAHDLPLNGYKVVAFAVLVAQPLIAAFGVAAVILAVRGMRRPVGAA